MWPFSSRALFPPPTQAWLQRVLSDPEAQGWGAWSGTQKTPLKPEYGDRKEEEETGEKEDNEEDSDFPLFLLERENLPKDLPEDLPGHPVPDQVNSLLEYSCLEHQELEAIKRNLWAMEQAQEPELPRAQGRAGKEEGAVSVLAPQLLGPETGCPCPEAPVEKVEVDPRSIYVGNVDYESTVEELEAYFNLCGKVQWISIPCNKFSGHPKGCVYIEFATESSAQAVVGLDQSMFRGQVIKEAWKSLAVRKEGPDFESGAGLGVHSCAPWGTMDSRGQVWGAVGSHSRLAGDQQWGESMRPEEKGRGQWRAASTSRRSHPAGRRLAPRGPRVVAQTDS